MKISDLVFENPYLMIMLEHFNVPLLFKDKNVSDFCRDENLDIGIFVLIANLYNGFQPSEVVILPSDKLPVLISFLQNSHSYYLKEKIPEIKNILDRILELNDTPEVRSAKLFFSEYEKEVEQHLYYEEKTAFPYFASLLHNNADIREKKFSARIYRRHHSDIETKVTDLKKLFAGYIPLKSNRYLKRNLLFNLLELESDLNIHSILEEYVLIPSVTNVEKYK
ncbi:MAG: hemerythrin domain-containing protein [Bacteroidales bacterium]|nr:hemerythrin domain-containing protein [Bacteroidales bacterium]